MAHYVCALVFANMAKIACKIGHLLTALHKGLIGFGRERKTPAPWDHHGRNSTIILSTTDTSPPTNIITMVCCLPLLRRVISGSTQSNAGNLLQRGLAESA